ncbi:type II toxin-antitoxin system VapB family antitoxin [Roseomonas sp. KE2513]|uniref:type II toxin-antitoxin system VapB family antitoxin n=1 Tax=Roseomonas sp. KE2513 TaxID=2479202 RepID=UPI001E2BA1B9|nr:type II toxin-antitoxin system VapB family antitoxin [Roseomonas sp. KE2513]
MNIEIDDDLLERAQKAFGLATKEAAVEEGLRLLVRLREQEDILWLAGTVTWQGDLGVSREGRGAQ